MMGGKKRRNLMRKTITTTTKNKVMSKGLSRATFGEADFPDGVALPEPDRHHAD